MEKQVLKTISEFVSFNGIALKRGKMEIFEFMGIQVTRPIGRLFIFPMSLKTASIKLEVKLNKEKEKQEKIDLDFKCGCPAKLWELQAQIDLMKNGRESEASAGVRS